MQHGVFAQFWGATTTLPGCGSEKLPGSESGLLGCLKTASRLTFSTFSRFGVTEIAKCCRSFQAKRKEIFVREFETKRALVLMKYLKSKVCSDLVLEIVRCTSLSEKHVSWIAKRFL